MLKVTVELVSAVDSSRNRVLGVAVISNDAKATIKSTGALGDYNVRLSKWSPKLSQVWKRGRVSGFDRRNRGAWDLLYLALRECVGSRNLEAT